MTVLVTPNIADAIAKANQWVVTAKPVIRAWFALDDIAGDLFEADQRTRDEARGLLRKPRDEMYRMIEGIRDDFRCDHVMYASDDADEAEWDRVEEFNDELDRGMASVAAAIKQVEAEL
ncbi:hypothetical protein [Sphingobium sp. ZW T5_29]|uniref:hypothetical protein n=1 Tax=Sphingobium sp. ZW T5_29 TaxID=3378077 RepID=UPI00385330DF